MAWCFFLYFIVNFSLRIFNVKFFPCNNKLHIKICFVQYSCSGSFCYKLAFYLGFFFSHSTPILIGCRPPASTGGAKPVMKYEEGVVPLEGRGDRRAAPHHPRDRYTWGLPWPRRTIVYVLYKVILITLPE